MVRPGGPPPHYQPRLRQEDLEAADKILRRRKSPQAKAQRARLARLLAENPKLSNPEAGRLLGVHENTVRYWRKRWCREGFRLDDKPRPGRPPIFSPEADRGHQGRGLRTARPA